MKKNIFAIIGIIILGVIIYLLVTVVNNDEKKATKKLNELAGKFYGYYYEDQSSSMKEDKLIEFLSSYAGTGFKISLKDLKIYLDGHNIENYDELKSCDEEKTRVIILPVSPYKKDNYEVKLDLECKF